MDKNIILVILKETWPFWVNLKKRSSGIKFIQKVVISKLLKGSTLWDYLNPKVVFEQEPYQFQNYMN